MKLKLTNNELVALCTVCKMLMDAMHIKRDNGHLDMQDKLDLALVERMWVTMYKKQFNIKPKHNLTLANELALCFFIQFNDQNIGDPFVSNIVHRICNEVHQKFA